MFYACRVGEAQNPGPNNAHQIRIAIVNPTAVHQKVGKIMKLGADVVSLSETSATHAVQNQTNHDLSGFGYRAFWSSPVSSKKQSAENRPSLRGEAVGSALFTNLPSRKLRSGFTDMLWETQRISMSIIRICNREVLFISIYGFANRYREGKRPNDLLLAGLIPVISEVGLPYCILGDFNEPPAKLPSFQFFRDQGAWEAFSWFQAKHAILLPATCAGSTRNDTAILHPWLLQFVSDMSVSQDVTFEPHSPFMIDLNFKQQWVDRFTWNLPKSWASFAPPQDFIAEGYTPVDFDGIHSQLQHDNNKLVDAAFAQWSCAVETAVDWALSKSHALDPVRYAITHLHPTFKGRCSFKKPFAELRNHGVKSDRHGGYTPPSEVFSLKSRLKTRQVRRLKSLLRRLKSLNFDLRSQHDQNGWLSAQREWDAILSAKGYGNKWSHWILAFEIVAFLPMTVPEVELLETVTQITEHDCNCACIEESRCRRDRFKSMIQFDQSHDFSRMSYKIIKSKKTPQLQDVPVHSKVSAKLLRSTKRSTALLLDKFYHIPARAVLTFNDAELEFVEQADRKVYFKHLRGRLEPTGILTISFHAVTEHEILHQFDRFWRPYWLRDDRCEQFDDHTWQDFCARLESCSLPRIPSIPIDTGDVKSWMALIRKLPPNKAIGPCGWSNEELKALPEKCIRDLVKVFNMTLSRGFTPSMMMAKTILLSKKDCPQSMHDARPITILSCLYRLFGRMMFKTISKTWSRYLPASVSGGLPGRGVKEIAYIQKREIEEALASHATCGGYSLDLIKAFNTFGRFCGGTNHESSRCS